MENQNLITEEKLVELYSDHILNHGERPMNVYRFAKDNDFEEENFYDFFPSFEQIEKSMLENLFQKSVELASEVNHQELITSKEKLLNVYFIFFENLTLNRTLILMILGNSKYQFSKITTKLKKAHRDFLKTLEFNDWEIINKSNDNIKKIYDKSREEGLWLHLVSAIEFWKKDVSPAFEKTDLFLEKTIDTGFELLDNEPIKKVLDLGKFLFKEIFKKN